jgi:hypothetical protein
MLCRCSRTAHVARRPLQALNFTPYRSAYGSQDRLGDASTLNEERLGASVENDHPDLGWFIWGTKPIRCVLDASFHQLVGRETV